MTWCHWEVPNIDWKKHSVFTRGLLLWMRWQSLPKSTSSAEVDSGLFYYIHTSGFCRFQLASINWYCSSSISWAVTVTWSPVLASSLLVLKFKGNWFYSIGPCLLIFTIFVCKCRDWSMQVQNSATSPFFVKISQFAASLSVLVFQPCVTY